MISEDLRTRKRGESKEEGATGRESLLSMVEGSIGRLCVCVCARTCRDMHHKHMSKVNVLETHSKTEAAKQGQYVRAGSQAPQHSVSLSPTHTHTQVHCFCAIVV